jgi:hypothetical protein
VVEIIDEKTEQKNNKRKFDANLVIPLEDNNKVST